MAPIKSPTLTTPMNRLRRWVRISRMERSINSDATSITNMLYLQFGLTQFNSAIMNLIMLEEQRSFENKMDNINHTNELLDELQKKMNSYFHQNSNSKSNHPILLSDDQQFKRQSNTGNKFKQLIDSQPRISNATVYNKAKKNDSFRLLGKARTKNEAEFQQKNIQTENQPRESSNMRGEFVDKKHENESLQWRERDYGNDRLKAEQLKKNDEQFPQAKTRNNSLVREMETMQILMKEKMLAKQRRIRQLQQQIITENEQRVYLYKVNVRLEEELKFLQQAPKQNDRFEWQICRMQEEIERLKKQLQKRKKEKKQLKREEQTLKDGYRTIVQNRRDITMKQLQKYTNQQKESKQSVEMLKSLMEELDKLKGAVEEKIKSKSRRKVIKSFKY